MLSAVLGVHHRLSVIKCNCISLVPWLLSRTKPDSGRRVSKGDAGHFLSEFRWLLCLSCDALGPFFDVNLSTEGLRRVQAPWDARFAIKIEVKGGAVR